MNVDGREVLMLAGANYLDLAGDSRVLDAANRATSRYGSAAGGARLISGNLDLHETLEAELADAACSEASLLFSTGYMANLGVITSLVGPGDAVFSDQLNHASIVDACRLTSAETRVFRHDDPDHFESLLKESTADRKILVTDGVYSMDGDVANLEALVPIARKYGVAVVLDDAHGFGVLGERGRGVAELANVEVDFLVGNLGKALGSFGAFVACSARARDFLINTARSFIFTCGLAPGPTAAALEALRISRTEPERRKRLAENAELLRTGLQAAGYRTGPSCTQVVPAIVGDNAQTMRLCEQALERGVYAQGIRYPTVPKGTARLRLTPTAGHTSEEIQQVVNVLSALAKT
jgi:8-amino-7-oxononanoate synthase